LLFSHISSSNFRENEKIIVRENQYFRLTLLVGELKSEGGRLKALCAGIRGVDPKLVEMILAEVVPQQSTGVRFQDIAGQDKVNRSRFFLGPKLCFRMKLVLM
jgi:hypothetical protein